MSDPFIGEYSFLHNYIREGDRILLYGMGKNGNKIFRELQASGKYRIVGFIDVRAGELAQLEVPLYLPESLKTELLLNYDKLILTIENYDICLDVYRQLVDTYGVKKESILSFFMGLGTCKGFTADASVAKAEIRKFLKNHHRKIMYFKPVILELNSQEGNKVSLRLKSFLPDLLPEERIVLAYIMYYAGRFDSQLLETIIQAALQIDDPAQTDFLYGRFIDTGCMVLLHEELIYSTFYIQRRELLKKVCLAYGFEYKKTGSVQKYKEKIKKICFVASMMDHHRHSATLFCIQAANLLVECGCEVEIVSLDTPSNLSEIPLLQAIVEYDSVSKKYEQFHRSALKPQIIIHYPENTSDIYKKMQGQLDKIFVYSPDLIIDISDDYSVLSYIYGNNFSTFFWPIRGYVSSSYFTYFGVRDKMLYYRQNASLHHPVAEEQECKIELPMYIFPPEPVKVYSREAFSCEKNDFLLITVGDRLGSELSREMIDAVCDHLLTKPQIKWFVVGEKNQYLMEKGENFKGKIVHIPYEEDLPALYKICDVYLNPPRMGGGISIIWAMNCGLPAVMSSEINDQSRLASIKELTYESFDGMADIILGLRCDSSLYEKCSVISKERINKLAGCQLEMVQQLIHELEINNRRHLNDIGERS